MGRFSKNIEERHRSGVWTTEWFADQRPSAEAGQGEGWHVWYSGEVVILEAKS